MLRVNDALSKKSCIFCHHVIDGIIINHCIVVIAKESYLCYLRPNLHLGVCRAGIFFHLWPIIDEMACIKKWLTLFRKIKKKDDLSCKFTMSFARNRAKANVILSKLNVLAVYLTNFSSLGV